MKKFYVVVIVILITLIGTPYTHISTAQDSYSHHISRSGSEKIKVKTAFTSFEIEYEGDIIISDDDRDIIGITDGGYFKVKKSAFGNKRRVEIDADRNGALTRKYYVGRREQAYIPQGEDWLAEMLPEIFKTTTLGAKSRHERIFSNGGLAAVIEEIESQNGDFIKTHYFGLLLNEDLDNAELAEVIDALGDEIDSDHYLASLLSDNRSAFLSSDQAIKAYIDAAGSINSDHYISEVLRDAIGDKSLSEDNISAMLEIIDKINSDHYITEVLQALLSDRDINDRNLTKVLNLSENVNSDHYKAELLKDAIDSRGRMNEPMLNIVLDALEDINSDHYATEIIQEIKRQKLNDAMVAKVINYSADNIDSDHYKSESFRKMIDRFDLGLESLKAIVDGLDDISDDNYTTEIIQELSDKDNLTEDQLIQILNQIEKIDSDHYKTEALRDLAPLVTECGSQVSDAYRKAAKTLNSETYYGRALRAID